MEQQSHFMAPDCAAPEANGVLVSIFVPDTHPLMQLKAALDWEAIRKVMCESWRKAGKNVDGGRGRPWPVDLYVPLLILMWVEALHSRDLEKHISESVVARRFLDLTAQQMMHVRDHSNIARAEEALGIGGRKEVNALLIETAQRLKFTNGTILSSDTTVQEPAIGYPNEPGILKGLAERVVRGLKKVGEVGGDLVEKAGNKAREIIRGVKEHHLFATGKEAKTKLLTRLVEASGELLEKTEEIIKAIGVNCGAVKDKAKSRLTDLIGTGRKLLPQIRHWLTTGKVAVGKIIHVGVTEARAIVKAKRQTKFGLKWRINRLCGGYLFGERVEAQADENKMPAGALADYREQFGEKASPEMLVYDRGASVRVVSADLREEGVVKVGIPPRGQGNWEVSEEDRKVVMSERGKTEGSIGRIKSRKYSFSHRQERSTATQTGVGQRVFLSANLNTLVRDLAKAAR